MNMSKLTTLTVSWSKC